MPREIKIDIGQYGEIGIEAVGFTGPDCEKFTKAFEEALGKVKAKRRKPEYSRTAVNQQRQKA